MNQVFFVIRLKGNDFFTFSTWLILYHGWCYFQKSLVTKGSNPFWIAAQHFGWLALAFYTLQRFLYNATVLVWHRYVARKSILQIVIVECYLHSLLEQTFKPRGQLASFLQHGTHTRTCANAHTQIPEHMHVSTRTQTRDRQSNFVIVNDSTCWDWLCVCVCELKNAAPHHCLSSEGAVACLQTLLACIPRLTLAPPSPTKQGRLLSTQPWQTGESASTILCTSKDVVGGSEAGYVIHVVQREMWRRLYFFPNQEHPIPLTALQTRINVYQQTWKRSFQ